MSPTPVTEEEKVHLEWYKEASKQTLDTLPEFMRKLSEDYSHDYGTVCHMVAAGAVAAAWAMNQSKGAQGGITGFQAGAVMWEFIRHWNHSGEDKPMRLLDYNDLLYPQYAHKFQVISKSTWEWAQEKAKENLKNSSYANPEVIAHWRSVAEGFVPFGLRVGEEY